MRRRDRTGRRTLLVLAIIFIALVAITFLQSAQPEPEAALPFERVYDDITEQDIRAVRLRDPNTNSTFTISRNVDGTWSSPDLAGTLDQQTATLVARTIATLPYDSVLSITQDMNIIDYGFAPSGTLAIDIVLINNQEARGVIVGGLAPTNGIYYALVDDRQEIYFIYRGAIDFLIGVLRTPPVA